MDLELVKEIGKCCCCGESTADNEQTNMVRLDMTAEWEFPRLGHVFDGGIKDAVAIICDPCGDRFEDGEPPAIRYAIEFLGDQLVYHDYIPRTHGTH